MENINKQITETLKTENINFTAVHVGFYLQGWLALRRMAHNLLKR